MNIFSITLLGLCLAILGGSNITQTNDIRKTQEALVYSICNQARQEISGASEQDCGEVQERLNIKFSCENRNSLPTNKCWAEAK